MKSSCSWSMKESFKQVPATHLRMRLGGSRLYGNVGTGPIKDVETTHDVFGPSCIMRYASRVTSSDHQLLTLLASASLGRLMPSVSLTWGKGKDTARPLLIRQSW